MTAQPHILVLLSVNDPGSSLFPIVLLGGVIILLLFASALVSAAEVSFFSISPAEQEELAKMEGRRSKIAVSLLQKPKDLLAAIVITNNFFNVGIIILGAYLSSLLFPVEAHDTLEKFLADALIITAVILLFGEIIPKIYATKNGKKVLLQAAIPIYYLSITPPFSWLAKVLVKGTARINNEPKYQDVTVSTTELAHALELTMEEDNGEHDQKILAGIVRFGKKDVGQVMRPRLEVEAVDVSMKFLSLYRRIVLSGFSRIPVYRGSLDSVIGVLYVKDLLPHLEEKDGFEWQKLIREPYFVPETRKIDDLLKDFQSRNVHLAVAVDEYGGTRGIITLEDVLEEIVGDISDEFDEDELCYSRLDDFNYVFEGKIQLVDFYSVLGIEGKEFEDAKSGFDSLGGFIMAQAGKILKKGDRLTFGDYQFTIESADPRKIKRIKVTKLAPGSDENE